MRNLLAVSKVKRGPHHHHHHHPPHITTAHGHFVFVLFCFVFFSPPSSFPLCPKLLHAQIHELPSVAQPTTSLHALPLLFVHLHRLLAAAAL
jgi:hypothetical protein